jgi:hypothetical protein
MLITLDLYALCGSWKKLYLLPYTSLTEWFYNRCGVFTARYELCPYITRIAFVLNPLTPNDL